MNKKKGRAFKKFIQNTLCRRVIAPIVAHRYNYHYEKITGVEGPALIIANHVTNMDPFLVGMTTKTHLAFVATENIMRGRVTGYLINHLVDIIIHRKGKSGLRTIMDIKNNLAMGDSVLLFPEGNRSFNGETCESDIEGLVKMIGKLGATIVTYRLQGGYLTTPRWATKYRRGRIDGRLMNIYTPETLKSNISLISEKIKNDIYVNAFTDQKKEKIAYKGKNLAYGMESFLFYCPSCERLGGLKSDGDTINCTCGLRLKYNEYGELINETDSDVLSDLDLVKWDRLQRKTISEKPIENISFGEDKVIISEIGDKHAISSRRKAYIDVKEGIISVRFDSDGSERRVTVNREDLSGVSIFSRNVLTVYYNDIHYEIRGDVQFNALKYLYLYNRR